MKYLIIFCMIASNFGVAQQPKCGTSINAEQQKFIDAIDFDKHSGRLAADDVVNIPLKIHIVRESNGEGGLSASQINQAISNANNFYQNSNIRFFLFEGINYIDNSDFYDFSASDEGKLAVPNDVKNTINIYFFNTLSSRGSPLCGYTRFPPSEDRVFMANGCTFGGTFEHELGHYFTLYHTHGKTNTGTTDELVDGSNCTTAGDNICDTPADPNLTGKVSPSCQYTGSGRDANGDFFVPLVNNIMAYSLDQCQNAFTSEQYSRMRVGFEQGRSYLNFTTEGFAAFFTTDVTETCIGSSVKFEANSFGATAFNWTFEGGNPATSTLANPIVEYEKAGNFDVNLAASNSSGGEASFEQRNYISIKDPLENSISEIISNSFESENLPVEWFVENPDKGYSFEISSIDIDGSGTSNSLFINNYEYESDNLGNVDDLFLSTYQIDGIRGFTVNFAYAYTFKPGWFDGTNIFTPRYDTLDLVLELGCLVPETVIWSLGGADLATVDESAEAFFPTANESWIEKEVYYELASEFEYAIIKIRNISYNGNNLFIDNLQVIPDFDLYSPTNLSFEKLNNQIILKWKDNSINELNFVVEQKPLGSTSFQELASLPRNTVEYSIDISSVDELIEYRIVAKGLNENISVPSDVLPISKKLVTGFSEEEWLVWPNPVLNGDGILNFTAPLNTRYRIYSLLGQVLMEGIVEDKTESIQLNSFKEGIYLLSSITEDGKSNIHRIQIK